MELLKKTSEPAIPKKRPFGNSSDCHLVEFVKHRKRVQVSRDFPPGCGITEADSKIFKNSKNVGLNLGKLTSHGKDKMAGNSQPFKPKEFERNKPYFGSRPTSKVKYWDPISSKEGHPPKPKVTISITRRKPFKNVGNVDSNLGKMTSSGKAKLVEFQPLKHNQPKESGRNSGFLGARRNRKVKFLDPIYSKEGDAPKPEVTFKNLDSVCLYLRQEQVKREKIREAMIMFDQVNEKLYQDNKLKPKGKKIADWRVPQEAAKIVKGKLKWMDPEKILGPICGVQIGDKFKYRAQLQMVGLHCQPHSGIDYTKIEGKNLAISIVDSHRYANESGCCDMLIYCGQGGLGFMGVKLPAEDQKLERGNLALRNSMVEKTPVRVIRKVQGAGKGEFYVYDGLYIVKHCTQRSEEGKTVFKFQLDRVPGQPELLRMINGSR